jgi:aspartyl-tRNA(Asn)/glutamyl-tRNA(Gln) amidotransferase subunit C
MWNRFSGKLVRNIITNLNTSKYLLVHQVSSSSLHPAIPKTPVASKFMTVVSPDETVIDSTTIDHLERISLVDFANVRGIERLEEAIRLAEVIKTVDTTGVEPMYSIMEDQTLVTRKDIPEPPNCRKQLMDTASVTEEDYFVAPQGNIPLSLQKNYDREESS